MGLHHPGGMEEGAGATQRDRGDVPTQRPSCLDPLMRGSSWGSYPTLGSGSPGHLRPRQPLAWDQTRPLAFLGPRQDAAGFFSFKKTKKNRKNTKLPRNGKKLLFWSYTGLLFLPCRHVRTLPASAALAGDVRGTLGTGKPTGKNAPPAVSGLGVFFVCLVQPAFVFAGVHGGEHAWVLVTLRAAPVPSDVPACVSGGCFPPPVHTFGRRFG